jgi:2'-hydroxyisoflavone reductase
MARAETGAREKTPGVGAGAGDGSPYYASVGFTLLRVRLSPANRITSAAIPMTTRRDFLKLGAAIAVTGSTSLAPTSIFASSRVGSSLRILILGGTGFIGPRQVDYAVRRGHQVTIFTRGRRHADLPDSVEHLIGDREGQLDALRGRTWDVVIDNSATNPAWVRQTAELLRESVGRYLFVSSTGVYLPYTRHGIDETVPPRLVDDPETGRADSFGVQKALSERVVLDTFGDRGLIVRPHYIVGPGDTTDRFPYWPVRIARGGEILVPGDGTDPVQLIDVRDLSEWLIRLVESGASGIFNATGPAATLNMAEMVYGIRAVTTAELSWVWIDDLDFLAEHALSAMVPWVIPRGDTLGMSTLDGRKAMEAGLTLRPLADTARDTLLWWATVPEERRANPRFVLTPKREAEVVRAWRERHKDQF